MKSEIIKTKFLCKNTMRVGSIHNTKKWDEIYTEGKIYDGEYETWSWEDGYKCNGGWKSYFVIDEFGVKNSMPRARFKAVFYDVDETRNKRIEEILKSKI